MRKAFFIIIVFFVSLTLPLSSAQELGPPSWEIGWETDMDSTYLVELEDDWDLSGELVFFINNERTTEINVDLTYDYGEESPFIFDGPDSVSVASSTNKSVTITITGEDAETVRAFSPNSTIQITVKAEEIAVGGTPVRTEEIQGDVSTPRMYRLLPEVLLPSGTLFSGSWIEFTLEVSNLGNNKDAILSSEATIRSCPHLSVTGLDLLNNVVVEVTDKDGNGTKSFTLRLEATSSHQERTCEVSVSIESEGDNKIRSSTMNVNVVAPNVDDSTDTEDEDAEAGITSSGTESTPSLSAIEIFLVILLTTVFVARRQA